MWQTTAKLCCPPVTPLCTYLNGTERLVSDENSIALPCGAVTLDKWRQKVSNKRRRMRRNRLLLPLDRCMLVNLGFLFSAKLAWNCGGMYARDRVQICQSGR